MTAKIKLNAASGGGSVSLKAPSTTTGNAAIELQLPVADGSSNQTLVTNGSGTLSFQAQGYGAFHVRSSQNNGDTAQSVAQTTITKVQFKYELADLDVDTKVLVEVQTISFFLRPKAKQDRCNALVAEFTAIAYFDLT